MLTYQLNRKYENLFPGLSDAMKTEQFLAQQRVQRPASAYVSLPSNMDRKPVEEMQQAEDSGQFRPILSKSSLLDEEEGQEEQQQHRPGAEGTAIVPEAAELMRKNITDMEQLSISGQQQEVQPPVVAESQPVAAAAKVPEKSLLNDDDEEFHDTAKTAILDHELEMDLASLEYDENVDTSEINLDDDLLDD